MRPPTSMASPSLVNSSATVRHLSCCRWHNDRTQSRRTTPGSDRTAVAAEPREPASLAACAAPEALPHCRPPQPICPARAHAVARAPEKDADAAITVARIPRRQALHSLHYRGVLRGLAALIAQRRSRHREQRAGPPRRETTLPAIRNLLPASRHAHQFFAATSFITSISRSRSATSFFSRAFSASTCFSCLTSLAPKPPKRLRQCRSFAR
jgi:hypothetical protein